MALSNTLTTYGSVSKFFHWLISFLVIVMLSIGFFLSDFPENFKGTAYSLHKLTGISILFLVILRLCWRLINVTPRLPGTPLWERVAEWIVHNSLYFFIILMPIVGWVGSIAAGRPPRLGNFVFNLPIAQNKEISTLAFTAHEYIAWILIVLISAHVLAALYHHYIRKDAVLVRMLPGNDKRN